MFISNLGQITSSYQTDVYVTEDHAHTEALISLWILNEKDYHGTDMVLTPRALMLP